MNQELLERYINDYRNYLTKIRGYISLQKDYLSLKNIDIGYINDGIIPSLKEFWNDIKNYISKNIIKLEVPYLLIKDDIEFLKHFSKLDTLIISDDYLLSPQDIKKIYDNTKVRKIFVSDIYKYKEHYKEKDFIYADIPYDTLHYNSLTLNAYTPIEYIEDKYGPYSLSSKLVLYTFDLNKDQIEHVFNPYKDKVDRSILINTNDGNKYYLFFKNEKEFSKIKVTSNNPYDAIKFYNYLVQKGYKLSKIDIDVQDIDYLNIDWSLFEELSKHVKLSFIYSAGTFASYESFMGVVQSIKWYKSLIKGLSPTEKVMFTFDILKTFSYNEGNKLEDASTIHRVLETGNIVCAGYAALFIKILKDQENIKVGDFSVMCKDTYLNKAEGHARNIVQIDDDKYNIHGIFTLDVTWDSFDSNIIKNISKDYNALDVYKYFLIPSSLYSKFFPNDTVPNLFQDISTLKECNMLLLSYNEVFHTQTHNLTNNDIEKYLNAQRPSLETFNKILLNVRIAEGYSEEQAMKEVEKVNRINNDLIDMMNAYEDNITFFEKEAKK